MAMTKTTGRGGDAPLFAWGDALRTARARRRRLVRRSGLVLGVIVAVAATIVAPPLPRLVWNASASAPVGLYAVRPGVVLGRGDMVVAWSPAAVRPLAAERHYLPQNVPLVKRVAGIAGDEICALGSTIYRDGVAVAARKRFDGRGRSLPAWRGCRILRGSEIFLLNDTPDSFDGRYFGTTEGRDFIGKARLLWAQ